MASRRDYVAMGSYVLRHRADRRGLWLSGNCGCSRERRESVVLHFPYPLLGFAGWRVAPAKCMKRRRGSLVRQDKPAENKGGFHENCIDSWDPIDRPWHRCSYVPGNYVHHPEKGVG